jgi:hypothetical protein
VRIVIWEKREVELPIERIEELVAEERDVFEDTSDGGNIYLENIVVRAICDGDIEVSEDGWKIDEFYDEPFTDAELRELELEQKSKLEQLK